MVCWEGMETYPEHIREVNQHVRTLFVATGDIQAGGDHILGFTTFGEVVCYSECEPSLGGVDVVGRTFECFGELYDLSPAYSSE